MNLKRSDQIMSRDLIVTNGAGMRVLRNKRGEALSGEDLIQYFARKIDAAEAKGTPYPISQQRFCAWVKQTRDSLEKGENLRDIFKKTLVRGM